MKRNTLHHPTNRTTWIPKISSTFINRAQYISNTGSASQINWISSVSDVDAG